MRPFLHLLLSLSLVACGDSGEDSNTGQASPNGSGSGQAGTSASAGSAQGGAGGSVTGAAGTTAQAGAPGTGGATGEGGAAGAGQAGAGDGGAAQAGAGGAAQGGEAGAGQGGQGPFLRIHLRSLDEPYPQTDGLSGQTPTMHTSGMRRFELFDDAGASSVVFDLTPAFVEASYLPGSDTVVATVPWASVPRGSFVRGRVVHTHVRYQVSAVMHTMGVAVPGVFDNVQVLSDSTTLDGATKNHGDYTYVFSAGGMMFPRSGSDAPIPVYTSSGGFSVTFGGGEWAYEFPFVATVGDAPPSNDVDVFMDVNMDKSFRWADEAGEGYADGVFDCTPQACEKVQRFGANSFTITQTGL